MREDKSKKQEELLAEVFHACMEEELSFIPSEREIARMHTFSEKFQSSMDRMCRTKGKPDKREITRHEFTYGFNRVAACILAVFLIGGIGVSGFFLTRSDKDEAPAKTTEDVAEAAPEASIEDTAGSSGLPSEEGAGAETDGGTLAEEALFLEQTVSLAKEQELPSSTEELRTLVSSPVLARDAQSVKVTIGNLGELPVSYHLNMELQVQIDGAWYTVPQKEGTVTVDEAVTLEPGMAQDEELILSNYALDYEAKQYRTVILVDDTFYGAPFRFETLEEGLEEAFEHSLESTGE